LWDWLTGEADKVEAAVKFLTNYADYLQFQDIGSWLWNSFVWGAIKILYGLNRGLEKLLLQSFDVGDFLKDKGLTELQTTFATTLGAILLLISLIWIGIKMMVSKNPPKLKDTLMMLVTAVFILLFSGSIVNTLFDHSKTAFNDVTQISKNAPSIQIIQDNTSDLITVLKKKKENIKPTDKLNAITDKNFWYTDINAVITPDSVRDIKDKTKNDDAIYLDRKLTVDNDGKTTAGEYKDNFIASSIYDSGYRRYATKNGVIFTGEASLAVGYLFIIFSIIMCIFELMYKKFYLLVATATDLDTGQRRNKAIESIAQSLLLIAFTGLELRIYIGILNFLGGKNLNPILYVICLVVSTFLLFKGSQSVAAIFGVDTSLKNGGSSLMAALGAAGVARGIGRGTKNVATSTFSATKKGINRIRNKNTDSDESDTSNLSNEEQSNNGKTGKEKTGIGDKAKEMARKSGKLRGYLGERKLSGAVEDGINSVKEKASDVVDSVKDGVQNPIDKAKEFGKDIKEEYDTGVDEGISTGLNKQSEAEDSISEEDISVPTTEELTNQTRGTNQDVPSDHKESTNLPTRELPESIDLPENSIDKELPNTGAKTEERKAKGLNDHITTEEEKDVNVENKLKENVNSIASTTDSSVTNDRQPIDTTRSMLSKGKNNSSDKQTSKTETATVSTTNETNQNVDVRHVEKQNTQVNTSNTVISGSKSGATKIDEKAPILQNQQVKLTPKAQELKEQQEKLKNQLRRK